MTADPRAVLMVMALAAPLAAITSAEAQGASVAHTKRCGEKVWSDGGPGYATIIQDLRVRGVSCAQGLRVAGRGLDGHPPAGWRCHHGASPIRCVAGRRLVTFVNGGDAG